jgi:hypothetical protein
MAEWPRQSWLEAEPARAAREQSAMSAVAPELEWIDDGGGWEGLAPIWPFERPPPEELDAFLAGRRLRIRVEYLEGFPMAAPRIVPIDPEPDPRVRTQHDWHVNGDGTVCLFQSASDWTGRDTAADLVVKSAGWFLEYVLLEAGLIDRMTTNGIVSDPVHDHLFTLANAPAQGG